MTSASELFYSRRSRTGRNTTTELGDLDLIPPPTTLDHRHHHHHHHHRHQEECDPFRRSHVPPQTRHTCHRVSQTQRESLRPDQHISRSHTGSSSSGETSNTRSNTSRFTRNDRLPGAVLQARARLLERLRGVSLTRNRQNSSVTSTSDNDLYEAISDNLRFVDAGDWETEIEREWLVTGDIYTEGRFQTEKKTKPAGLSREAIDNLQREVFDVVEEEGVSEGVNECCICLERFLAGDGLIRLLCGHRFHPVCLDPWVTTCGDCPYCRTSIGEETNCSWD